MKDYQPKYKNKYYLRKGLYQKTLAFVRDYDGMRQDRINIIHGTSSALDGMPRGSGTSDTTADKAMRILALDSDIDAIEKALNTIRPEYRHSVMTLIMTGKVPLNAYAHRSTIWRWKAKFLYSVAKNKFWI